MKKNEVIKLLSLPGVSGRENLIANYLNDLLKKNKYKIERDNLGSIFGVKKSKSKNAKTLMIDAHMDEVGFFVQQVLPNGMLRIEEIGYIWNYNLLTQRVRIYTPDFKKSFIGVITNPTNDPKANPNIKQRVANIEDLLIDIGASTIKEVENMGIEVGCTVVFDTEPIIQNNKIFSKALDDRIGIALVCELIEFISKKEFDFNIIIGGSVQEEVGLRGAKTMAHKMNPDIAMTIDISPAKEFKNDHEGKLGEGTMLRHFDRSTLYSRDIVNYVKGILESKKIKWQDYFSFGGTNAGSIHLSKNGVPTIPIGLLGRNLHTSNSIIDINDYENTLKLCKEIILDLNSKKIINLTTKE